MSGRFFRGLDAEVQASCRMRSPTWILVSATRHEVVGPSWPEGLVLSWGLSGLELCVEVRLDLQEHEDWVRFSPERTRENQKLLDSPTLELKPTKFSSASVHTGDYCPSPPPLLSPGQCGSAPRVQPGLLFTERMLLLGTPFHTIPTIFPEGPVCTSFDQFYAYIYI